MAIRLLLCLFLPMIQGQVWSGPLCKDYYGKCGCLLSPSASTGYNIVSSNVKPGSDNWYAVDGNTATRWETEYVPILWKQWRIEFPTNVRVLGGNVVANGYLAYTWQLWVGNTTVDNWDNGAGENAYCDGQINYQGSKIWTCNGGAGTYGKYLHFIHKGTNDNFGLDDIWIVTEVPNSVLVGGQCVCNTGPKLGNSVIHVANTPICQSCPTGTQWDGTKCRCSANYYCNENASSYFPVSVDTCPETLGSQYMASTIQECNFCRAGYLVNYSANVTYESYENTTYDENGDPITSILQREIVNQNQICSPCPVNFYCPDNATMLPCPAGSWSNLAQSYCTISINITSPQRLGTTIANLYTPYLNVPPTATNMASSGNFNAATTPAKVMDGLYSTFALNASYAQYWQSNSNSATAWLRLDLLSDKFVSGGYVLSWLNPEYMQGFEIWIGGDTNFPGSNLKCYQSISTTIPFFEKFTCGKYGRYLFYARTQPNGQYLGLGEWMVYTANVNGDTVAPTCGAMNNYCGCSFINPAGLSASHAAEGYGPATAQDGQVGSGLQRYYSAIPNGPGNNPVWLRMDMNKPYWVVGGVVRGKANPESLNYYEIWIGNNPTLPSALNKKCYQSINYNVYYEEFFCNAQGRYLFFARSTGGEGNYYRPWERLGLDEWTIYTGRPDPYFIEGVCTPYECTDKVYVNGSCVTCPVNTLFSNVNFRCECLPGYYCPYIYDLIPDGPGVLCPNNFTSLQDARSLQECFCKPGYINSTVVDHYSEDVPQYLLTCQPCTAGFRCPTNDTIIPCGAGNFSTTNSTSCSVCPANTYSGLASPECTSCFLLTVSPVGSTSIDNCTCVSNGYIKNGTYNCIPCPANFYCPNSISSYSCPVNSASSPGSYLQSQCMCNAAYQNLSDTFMMLRYSMEDPDPKLSYATSLGKQNIDFMGSYWSHTSVWKAFGAKSIVSSTWADRNQPQFSQNYIKFASNMPFNFATNNYTFSFNYRWAMSRATPMVFLRVGPMAVGQMGNPSRYLFLAATENGCLKPENWGHTTQCDKHSGSTSRINNYECYHVMPGCTGDIVYYLDGGSSLNGAMPTTQYHVLITSETRGDGIILMKLFVNGNQALNSQTVEFSHGNKEVFTKTYYGGYIGQPADGFGDLQLYGDSATAGVYMDELQIFNRVLNITERQLMMGDTRFTGGCELCGASMYCPGNGQISSCPLAYTSPPGQSTVQGCAQCTNYSTNRDDPERCTNCLDGYIFIAESNCRPCKSGSACPNMSHEFTCPQNTFSPGGSVTACTACTSNSISSEASVRKTQCLCKTGYTSAPTFELYGGTQISDTYNMCINFVITYYYDLFCVAPPQNFLQQMTLKPVFYIYNGQSLRVSGTEWASHDQSTIIYPAPSYGYGGFSNQYFSSSTPQDITVVLDFGSVYTMGRFYYIESILSNGGVNAYYATNLSQLTFLVYKPNAGFNQYQAIPEFDGVNARYIVLHWRNIVNQFGLSRFQMGKYQLENYQCSSCRVGSYCPGNDTSIPCPQNLTSPAGSTAKEACFCQSGFVSTGVLACRGCNEGYQCPDPTTETICPIGTYSLSISTSCTTCAANTYADTAGSAVCLSCPSNSLSAAGSTSKSNCNCNNNYYRNIDLNCLLCPAGYRCSGNQMIICPTGTFSAVGASVCTPCAQGYYTDNTGSTSCKICPDGAIVPLETTLILFNDPINRALKPDESNTIVIMRNHLPTGSSAINITKWSFYAWKACTVTPIIAQHASTTGTDGYGTYNMQITRIGTTRVINGAGSFTYDFLDGTKVLTKQYTSAGGGLYNNMEFFGWYYTGAACIPYDVGTPPGTLSLNKVVQSTSYNTSLPISTQTFTATIPTSPAKHDLYSASLSYSITTTTFATFTTGSISQWNCSCASGNTKLADGSCSGSCVDGKWLANITNNECRVCSQGMYCSNSKNFTCPPQTSSLPGSSQCQPCVGPDTHSNISQAMCGLRTCPKATAQTIPGTLWRGLGRFKVGRGGDGEVPSTHWYSGYRCMGMVLNASADRPVAILEQTLTVVPLKTYALRFKKTCTGQQCSAAFLVSVSGSLVYGVSTVSRSWMESGTPYFASASNNITVQFYAQMTTLSCTIWIGSLELVDMSGWDIASFTTIQLKTGVSFPVRYSPTYVFSVPHITLQIVSGGYIQQTATVLAHQRYELTMWAQGSVVAEYLNGTLAPMTPTPAYDTFPGWTQVVFRVDTTSTTLTVRISGVCLITPPTLKVYAAPTSRPCLECLPGYWCSSATINICPLNTISNASSYIQTDCFCQPGYYGRVELGVAYGYSPCTTCPANYYCNGGNQLSPCPAGTKSAAGSALDGCLPCPPEEFCGSGIVGNCPANSIPRPGAVDLSDCVCNPGFYGQAGNCSRCEVGFYCAGGVARVACTANAVSPMGSTAAAQCFCDRGYYGVNNSACISCPEGSWCWTGILNSCPANMWSPLRSSYQIECVCQYGYTGPNGGPCTACGTGQYKSTRGTDSCSLCTPGTSSAATGATSFLACASCNRGSYTPYTGQSSCIPCAAGDYADAYGSTVCLPCNVGYWSTQGFGTCQACPAGTFTNVTRTNSQAACVFCDPGHYSAAASTACSVCGACSYWTWPQRIVLRNLSAPVSFSSSIGAADRTQLAYYTATNALASSGSDLYLLSLSSGAATVQTLNTKQTFTTITHMFTSNDRTAVYTVQDQVYRYSLRSTNYLTYLQSFYTTSAPTGAVEGLNGQHVWVFAGTMMQRFLVTEGDIISVNYPSAFTTAVLANGCVHTSYPDYIFVAGKPAGGTAQWGFRKYQLSTGQWQIQSLNLPSTRKCFFTPDGYFVFLTTDTHVYYYSMTEDTMTLFYTGQVNNIYFDSGSSYVLLSLQSQRVDKVPFIIEDARNCGPGKYSLSGGLAAESLCETCPAGNVCPSGARITPCTPGTYSTLTGMRSQGQCTLCPPGFYCTGGTELQLCPLGSYSIMSGLSRLADCPLCPAGFYCTNTTDIAPCPTNTMSPSGSSDLASCSCNPGYRCEVTQVVHAEVELPITINDFEALRSQYIAAVAAAAGVDSSQVLIVSVTNAVLSVRRRRLLQQPNWVQIHTSIYNSKFTEKPHLALVNLQRQLEARGLPPHEPNIRITLHREVQKATRALSMRGA